MKHTTALSIILLIVLLSQKVYGQGTEELLKSKRVSDFIYLEPDFRGTSLEYQLDQIKDNKKFGKPLKKSLSITVSPRDESVNIMVHYFNPFHYKVVLSDTALVDANYEALNKFFESVSTLLNTVSTKNPAISPVLPTGGAALMKSVASVSSPLLQEWKYLFKNGKIDQCTPDFTRFMDALKNADNAFYNNQPTSFESKVKDALNQLNSPETLSLLTANLPVYTRDLNDINDLNTTSKGFITILESEVGKLSLDDPQVPPPYCNDFVDYTKNIMKTFINDIKDKQNKREEIQKVLEELSKNLNDFIKKSSTTMVDGTSTEAVRVGSYEVDVEKVTEISILFKEREVKFDGNTVSINDKDDLFSRKIRIRAHRTVIPEFATGVFYTNLKYPTYIVNDLKDSMVVAAGKTEKSPVVAAAHLNLVFDVWSDICPILQIGIGTAKERPSLLFGGGLRFSNPKRLALSFGGIWTWKKELTNLTIGQRVKESADLDKDLQYNFKTTPAFYLGIQYNF